MENFSYILVKDDDTSSNILKVELGGFFICRKENIPLLKRSGCIPYTLYKVKSEKLPKSEPVNKPHVFIPNNGMIACETDCAIKTPGNYYEIINSSKSGLGDILLKQIIKIYESSQLLENVLYPTAFFIEPETEEIKETKTYSLEQVIELFKLKERMTNNDFLKLYFDKNNNQIDFEKFILDN